MVATTSLELTLWNPGSTPREAQVLLPVPEGVSVRSMQYDGTGVEPTAKLLPRRSPRHHDFIVRRSRDPALLEFAGFNLIKSSVFPVPAVRPPAGHDRLRAGARTRRQSHRLRRPRSQSLEPLGDRLGKPPVRIRSSTDIASVYSPSHELAIDHSARHATVRFSDHAASPPRAAALRCSAHAQ